MSGINNNFDSSLSSSDVEDSQENEQNVNHSTHEAAVPLPPAPRSILGGDTQSGVSDFLGSASRDSERASVEPSQGENCCFSRNVGSSAHLVKMIEKSLTRRKLQNPPPELYVCDLIRGRFRKRIAENAKRIHVLKRNGLE